MKGNKMLHDDTIQEFKKRNEKAVDMLLLIEEFTKYPEMRLEINQKDCSRKLEIPFNERENTLHFLYAIWESERNRTEYFINKYYAIQKGGNEG